MIVGMGGTALFWLQHQYTQRRAKIDKQEIWTINSGCFALQADRCFSMHTKAAMSGLYTEGDYTREQLGNALDPEDFVTKSVREGKFAYLHKEYMKTGIPLITTDGSEGSYEYPLTEVVADTQSYYFTCTPAYMIAAAMLCRPKIIELHGVDFDYGDPRGAYEAGKPCVEYWIGRAQARKIDIRLHPMTNLMSMKTLAQKGLYGYGYEQPKFEIGGDGKVRVCGFAKNPPLGSRNKGLAAIPLNGGGNRGNGADRDLLAPTGVHRHGNAPGGLDDQFGVQSNKEQLELFDAYQGNNAGDGAGRGREDRAAADQRQHDGSAATPASPQLQQAIAGEPKRNRHAASDT